MKTIIWLGAILLLVGQTETLAQLRKKITFSEFYERLTSSDTSLFSLQDTDIIEPAEQAEIFTMLPPVRRTSDSLIIVDRQIELLGCRFLDGLSISGFEFRKHVFILTSSWISREVYPDELSIFIINKNNFNGGVKVQFEKGDAQPLLQFNKNSVKRSFQLIADDAHISVTDNTLDLAAKSIREESFSLTDNAAVMFELKQKLDFYISVSGHRVSIEGNRVKFKFDPNDGKYQPSFASYLYLSASVVTISGNLFQANVVSPDSSWRAQNSMQVIIQEKTKSFTFTENAIEPDLHLELGFGLNNLRFHSNNLRKLGFDPFKIPDQSNVLLWSDLDKAFVGLRTGDYGINKPYYSGISNSQIEDRLAYKELLKFYKKFYDEYKSSGDIRSSNDVYIKIKDLETSELRASYKESPSFNLFFRVKLNQLLKHYTAYGTDPAQALVASFWIIFLFAIFYFFFPSTWDISSKSTLLQDFKDFAEKNDKGYLRPFFKMLAGFGFSLMNAITLSLNAFVTLGFGEIPTKGVAKYVTVVQGFIGWFLLSIFTVSLVSQLLF